MFIVTMEIILSIVTTSAAVNSNIEDADEDAKIRKRDPDVDLMCHSNDQCGSGSQCMDVDSTGQGYCGKITSGAEKKEEENNKEWSRHMYNDRSGRLGSLCEKTSDCKPFTMDGQDKLCCQDVHRGRQGTKRMCDRVIGISVCID